MSFLRRAATALLALTIPASAQVPPSGYSPFPCPQTTIGWALQWPQQAILTSASYDSGTKLLYLGFYNSSIVQAFSNVPIGIMQSLSYTQTPLAIYNGSIVPSYHQILLTEKDHCTLQWESGGQPYGFIWTD